jgi:hypothetical protein
LEHSINMALRTTRIPVLLTLTLVSCLGACSSQAGGDADASGDSDPSSTAGDFPVLHLVQTAVMMFDGKPKEEDTYRTMLAHCKASGLATTPIAENDVTKIGRRRTDRTIEATRWSERTQEWSMDAPTPCHFKLVTKDQLVIYTADGKAYTLDETTHKGELQDVGAPQPPTPIVYGQEEAIAKAAGWKPAGMDSSVGQECAVWTGPQDDRVCVWTKGEKWGYSRYGANALDGNGESAAGSIVLWAKPGRNIGWQVSTESFTVGKSQGEEPFTVPSGTAVSKAN